MKVFVVVFLAAVWAAVMTWAAFGHGEAQWIADAGLMDPVNEGSCCGPRDCTKLADDEIKEERGGYRIKATGELWPYDRVIWKSKDGGWWRCEHLTGGSWGLSSGQRYEFNKGDTRCLIGPPPGS